MEHELTAAAQRVLVEAAHWTDGTDCDELLAPSLLLGLLSEPECQAALVLARYGIRQETVCQRWPAFIRQSDQSGLPNLSAEVHASLAAVTRRLDGTPVSPVLATEHLLLGLISVDHETGLWLRAQGLEPDSLELEILLRYGYTPEPLPLEGEPVLLPLPILEDEEPADTLPLPERNGRDAGDCENVAQEPPLPSPSPAPQGGEKEQAPQDNIIVQTSTPHPNPLLEGEQVGSDPASEPIGVLRVLDAAWNRAREGLRVVEDYTRFVLDDRHLTDQLKQLRHELTAAMASIPLDRRLAARETQADVGTRLSTPAERRRQDAAEVLTANFTRLQESLRSLEEFGKILDPELAARLEQIRYRTYTLHRAVEITQASLARLGRARLYVLIDGQASPEQFTALVGALISVGVDVLQLRDKHLDDRVLLQRARLLRELTQGTDTLFVMNDRPDLAVLSRADGVHVGQEELTVKDVRTLVGPEMLIGVSTHGLDQARQAVLDGADYLGVGPTFPSGTKQFAHFPGLDFLRQVAAEIRLPAFAIGGIHRENLPDVLSTGIARIAVSGAITATADPAAAARELKGMLGFRK